MIHELVEIRAEPEKAQVKEAVRIFSDVVRNGGGHVWTTVTVGDGCYAVCEAVFRSTEEWDYFRRDQKLRKKPGENAMLWYSPDIRPKKRRRNNRRNYRDEGE